MHNRGMTLHRRSLLAAPLLFAALATCPEIVMADAAPLDWSSLPLPALFSTLGRTAARTGKQVIRAALKPVRVRDFRKEPLLAFAGIGRPAKFFASLEEAGATVKRTVPFPDHHRFTEADATGLLTAAAAEGLRLTTTEKDMVRLVGAGGRLGELRDKSLAFGVALEFENAAAMGEMIEDAVLKVRRTG